VVEYVKGLLTPGAIVAIVIGSLIVVSLFPISYCAYKIHKKRKAAQINSAVPNTERDIDDQSNKKTYDNVIGTEGTVAD
jgi:hypothetical protein